MNVLNLSMLLKHAARIAPDHAFVNDFSEWLTYAEVDDMADRFSAVLGGLNVHAGDRVGMLLPNCPSFAYCYYGILRRGAIAVPFHVTTPAPALRSLLKDASISVLVADVGAETAARDAVNGLRPECRLIIHCADDKEPDTSIFHLGSLLRNTAACNATFPTQPSHHSVILYTAGTTAHPKATVQTHQNLFFQALYMRDEFWEVTADDTVLMVAPGAHIFGQTLMNCTCAARARLVLVDRFDPVGFFKSIEMHGVTFFAGVPTLAHLMLNHPAAADFDLSSLRCVMLGGAPLHPEIIQRFEERFRADVITGYGATEGVPMCYLNVDMMKKAPNGTIGIPAVGTEILILNESGEPVETGAIGEIVVRGPQMFSGYLHEITVTSDEPRDAWFKTGDAGYVDENGYYYIVDRFKDLIKRSGYSISPAEVERILLTHQSIAEAGVIGIPHEILGEEIKAIVVLKPGASVTEDELIEHCRAHLAAYKYPRIIEFRDSLPKSATGKVLRRQLREL